MTVRLVPFGPEHDAAFEETSRDPLIHRFTPAPDPVPEGYAAQWRGRFDDGRSAFAVLDEADVFVGYVVTAAIEPASGNAELGYAVSAAHRGRGVAVDALDLLTAWAFEQGIVRAYLLIDDANTASQRVASKAGYRFEGVLRSLGHPDGTRADMQSWSRLSTDPDW